MNRYEILLGKIKPKLSDEQRKNTIELLIEHKKEEISEYKQKILERENEIVKLRQRLKELNRNKL